MRPIDVTVRNQAQVRKVSIQHRGLGKDILPEENIPEGI